MVREADAPVVRCGNRQGAHRRRRGARADRRAPIQGLRPACSRELPDCGTRLRDRDPSGRSHWRCCLQRRASCLSVQRLLADQPAHDQGSACGGCGEVRRAGKHPRLSGRLPIASPGGAVLLAWAQPVFVDIEPATLCLGLAQAEQRITSRTRAVMFVSLNGRSPVDFPDLVARCRARNVRVIEDAAQSLGSFRDLTAPRQAGRLRMPVVQFTETRHHGPGRRGGDQ